MIRLFSILLLIGIQACAPAGGQDSSVKDRSKESSFNWVRLDISPPNPRLEAPLVYDPNGNRFIVFGGRDEDWTIIDETWQFDPVARRWSEIQTSQRPPARFMHAMVYDSHRRRLIVFGGSDGDSTLEDLWAFDLAAGSWHRLDTEPGPSSRQLHAMAYDSGLDRLILFGGRFQRDGQLRQLGDTWTFDLESNRWFEQVSHESPTARDHPALVYDPVNHLAILFGGESAGFVRNDTWFFDATRNGWTLAAATGSPSARDHHRMGFDAGSGAVLLVAGSFEDDRVFAFDSDEAAWQAREPNGQPPIVGDHMLGAAGGGQFILFGGFRGGERPLQTTWILERD